VGPAEASWSEKAIEEEKAASADDEDVNLSEATIVRRPES